MKDLKLILSCNNLGKDGIQSLFSQSFENCHNLTALDVSGKKNNLFFYFFVENDLGEEGMSFLATKLPEFPELCDLDLSFNYKTITRESKTREDSMEALCAVVLVRIKKKYEKFS